MDTRLKHALDSLRLTDQEIEQIALGPNSREANRRLALTRTKVQEAILWLKEAIDEMEE